LILVFCLCVATVMFFKKKYKNLYFYVKRKKIKMKII
jgi:hypothetical protein